MKKSLIISTLVFFIFSISNSYTTDNIEMKSLKITRIFEAKPEFIFDMFTKPSLMKVWWTKETKFEIDLKIGGIWKIIRQDGDQVYIALGTFLDVRKPNLIRYTYSMPQFSNDIDTITFKIKKITNGTHLTFTQEGNGTNSELESVKVGEKSNSEVGWNYAFDLIENSLK